MPATANRGELGQVLDFVRTEYQNRAPREILVAPPSALLGVSPPAEAALLKLEINTVFDLATSSVFGAATKLVNAATDLSSAIYQHGSPTSDLVRKEVVAGKQLGELQFLGITVLEGIPEDIATELEDALIVKTVRDLALYPAYRAAVAILDAAYFPEKAVSFDPELPADLLPKTGEYPTERVQYTTLILGEIPVGEGESIGDINSANFAPIDVGGLAAADAGFKKVAFGALLTFNQSWYSQGVTLGQLLHSTSLAPGESTRIAVIDWSRKSRAGETEIISETDDLSNDTTRNRSISEVTQAVANEAQAGFSDANTSSNSSQSGRSVAIDDSAPFGGAFGGTSVSAGASLSEASSSSHADSYSTSFGHRDIGSTMLQNVNDRTHQHAHSNRSRRASVIKEVSQSEHETASTRVLANYNHMHALTIQYYEVVQIYRVEVAIVKADRVLFIPFKLVDFENEDLIRKFQKVLLRAALSSEIRDALRNLEVLEIAPDRDTPVAALGQALNPIIKNPPVARRKVSVTTARVPSTPADAAPPAASAGATNLVQFSTTTPLAEQINIHIWSAEQTSRLSGLLNLSVLRRNSTSLFLPTDVVVEGAVVDSGGVPMTVTFHTRQGERITEISTEKPLALNLVAKIGITGSSTEREISATLTLTVNRNGVRFPVELPTVSIPKAKTGETRVVQVSAGGVNANLKSHLADNRMYYSQAVFRSLDTTQIALLLSGHGVSVGGRIVPVAQVVEPRPLRYIGNYLAFKMNSDPAKDMEWKEWLKDHGIQLGVPKNDIIPLASGGTFAEAVLGRSNCAEKLDITRFWNWQDSPIPLQPTEIGAIQTGSRATNEDVKPGQLSAPIINITSPGNLPDPAGTAAILAAIQNGNMFRDMSGLQGTIALAQSALQASSSGATSAAEQAGTNMNNLLKANTERQRVAAEMITSLARTAASAYTGGAIPPGGGISGGGGGGGISGDGARINQGRSMDSRGVPGPSGAGTGGAVAPVTSGSSGGGSGNRGPASSGDGLPRVSSTGAGFSVPQSSGYSHEGAYTDRSAFGYSPDAVNAVIGGPDSANLQLTQVGDRNRLQAAVRYAHFWADLLQFQVSASIVTNLASRSMSVQDFRDAIGDLNLDQYLVRITRMPTVNGVQLDAAAFLDHVRHNLNSFVDNDISTFEPFDNAIDRPKWESNSPLGAVLKINISGPDNASVVTSLAETTRWRFSTVRTPFFGGTGSHPVSGHREFGVRQEGDGSVLIYTRGADRTTGILETGLDEFAFGAADKLWRSLQEKIELFVNDPNHNGQATRLEPFSQRFHWSDVRIILGLPDQIGVKV